MAKFTYKIRFVLNNGFKPKSNLTPLSLFFRYTQTGNIDFRASTSLKIPLVNWNSTTQKINSTSRHYLKNAQTMQNFLNDISSYFNKEIVKYLNSETPPTKEDIKTLYNDFLNPPTKEVKANLFSFIDVFIDKAKTQPNQTTKKLVSNITLRGYGSTKNILIAFSNEVYKLDFENITIDFYYDFIEFCENRNLSYNYIGKHIKTIKTFMLSALNKDLHTNKDFQLKEFAKLKEDTESIYLNETELNALYILDLSKNKVLNDARDLFLIGAYTGLRFSDWHKVNNTNIKQINGIDMLILETQKTTQKVSIPLHSIVKNTLSKHKGTPPKQNAHLVNKHIKEVGRLAEIDTQTTKVNPTKNGLRTSTTTAKYELIQTHTARRSFCTNAYLLDMNTLDIMAISGHQTETAFLKYIKVSPEHRAVKIAKHSFFSNSNHLKIVN